MISPTAAASARPFSSGADWAPAALIALPFLLPYTAGPAAGAWQLLASWSCLAGLAVFIGIAMPARTLLIGLGLAATAIALRHGGDTNHSIASLMAVIAMAFAAFVGSAAVRGVRPRAGALAWGLLVAGLVSAVLGLLQYYGRAAPLVPWTSTPALGQAYGNLRQRNQFATLINMALIAVLWLYARHGERVRAALAPATALLIVAAAASTSRTGLVQLLGICGVAAFIARQERRDGVRGPWSLPHPAWLLVWVLGYFAASWLLPRLGASGTESLFHRLQHGDADDHGRIVLWHNVLTLIARHPWAGWGWGELAYAHYITLYPGPRFTEILDNAHNLPLHLAVELGIPVALLACGGFCWLAWSAKPWRERDPTRLMGWGLLAVIVLHSLLEYPVWYGPFQLVFGLCLGLLWPGPRMAHGKLFATVARAAVATILMATVAYAAWDYTRVSQLYLPPQARLAAYQVDTLAKVSNSWLFADQVGFAALSLTPLTPGNAVPMHLLAQRSLHFSPEPRVVIKLIESAALLGLDDEAFAQAERFKRAYPAEYAQWLKEQAADPAP